MNLTTRKKKWSFIFSDTFKLDRASFLMAMVIPLAVQLADDEDMPLVVFRESLEDVLTPEEITETFDILVAEKVAKRNIGKNSITIGFSKNFLDSSYFFQQGEEKLISKVKAKVVPKEIVPDFTKTSEILSDLYGAYETYCDKIRLSELPDLIHKKVNKITKKAKNLEPFEPRDIVEYLFCVNAMANFITVIPQSFTSFKDISSAKKILTLTSQENIFRVIPYFVTEYPKWAKEGYETTNLAVLSFMLPQCLIKMGNSKTGSKSSKNIDYDSDKL